jgi:adenylate cyclase
MPSWLLRIVDLGVEPGQTPAESRRVQSINLIAAGAIALNALYSPIPFAVGFGELWPVLVTNTTSIAVYLLALRMNGRGRTDTAMYLLFGGAVFNLVADAVFFGMDAGVWLFLITIPPVGILLARPGALRTQLVFVVAGLAALIGVVVARPAAPPSLAGSTLETVLFVASIVGTLGLLTMMGMHFRLVAERAEAALQEAHERSERLLHNTLPVQIAERLKGGETVIADRAEDVSILFADLVGWTPLSEQFDPDRMVALLNEIFIPFDELADALGIEKIKTVGDAYMVVGGLPEWREDHLEAVVEMALGMQREILRHPVDGVGPLQMRFGIHTGSVVAGVIGKRKFSYDLWGDAVNTAARMESHGLPGMIHVSEEVFVRLRDAYWFEPRGSVDIKGKGPMRTYFLGGRIED